MIDVVLVGVGGALGATARFLLGSAVATPRRATLAVNVLGSFLLGFLTAAAVDARVALVVGTGFCGAFTTFSSFAVEAVDAGRTRRPAAGVRLAALHLAGALGAVAVGATLGAVVL